MPKLTEASVASLPADRDRILFDSQLSGFGIRTTPAGTKIFVAQTYVNGRKRRVSLGRHPDLGVSKARELALQALADMRHGADPVVERKARVRAAAAGAMTMAALADKWLADHVVPKLKPRTAVEYSRLLARRIKPAIGHLTVAGIERDDIVRLHVAMARTPRLANFAIATIKTIINFGIDLGLRPPASNPARRIKLYRDRVVERFLSEAEIAKAAEGITAAERAGKIGPHAAAGLRLALFTGARRAEIEAARWDQADWQRKIIRLPDSKNNRPRTIHLSEGALEVLRGLPRTSPYIIAGAKPGEAYKNLTRAWIVAREYAGLRDVRLHDLRHSFASLAAGRGVSLLMIGKLLGHAVPQSTARYAHLAVDAASAVNEEIGTAISAAIAKGQPKTAHVVKLRRPRR
jgi:integrase